MKQQRRSGGARALVLQAPRQVRAAAKGAYESGAEAFLAGNLALASAFYQSCIALDPTHGEAHHGLGVIAARENRIADALAFFEKTVARLPHHAEAYANLCVLFTRAGRHAEAAEAGRRSVAARPTYANGHAKLAAALLAAGDAEGALAALRHARRLLPGSNAVLLPLAEMLARLFRHEEALEVCAASLKADPAEAAAHTIVGVVHQQRGDNREAFEAYARAVAAKPDYGHAHSNLCIILCRMARFREAAASGSIATRLMPDNPAAFVNYAVALQYQGDLVEANAMRRRALALAPGNGEWLIDITTARRFLCDWPGLPEEEARAAILSYKAGVRVGPFKVLTVSPDPAEHLESARVWASGFKRGSLWTEVPRGEAASRGQRTARACQPGVETEFHAGSANRLAFSGSECVSTSMTHSGRRLRIGYVSADFYLHATALLVAGVLEHHDRTRFELFGYSIGHNDGSSLRRRLEASFDGFADLRAVADEDAARRIAADRIDILVDLKGYTDNARTEIFALRPAPVQVNYLGYPGTMGADFIDYIVGDAFVTPFVHAPFFDEKIVQLPHCYQPNDDRRTVAEAPPSRGSCGLPEKAFVFCCFNNTYKITPDIFALWMRLLAARPEAVLWLFEGNGQVGANLRREAEAAGVDPARLVFAPRVSPAAHMARMALADLFLDTFPVNAHTTASEALWVGLPVLTCAGDTMVSRVAGSLLGAIGVPDLVTGSLAEYETAALALAADPRRLAALRETIAANRLASPLFDTAAYTRHFEAALLAMAARHEAGLEPEAFAVPPHAGL